MEKLYGEVQYIYPLRKNIHNCCGYSSLGITYVKTDVSGA